MMVALFSPLVFIEKFVYFISQNAQTKGYIYPNTLKHIENLYIYICICIYYIYIYIYIYSQYIYIYIYIVNIYIYIYISNIYIYIYIKSPKIKLSSDKKNYDYQEQSPKGVL